MAETLTQEEVLPRLAFDVKRERVVPGTTLAAHRQWERLEEELEKRGSVGLRTYGRPLTSFNGRDALRDAKEEVLDLLMYLKQWELECAVERDRRVPQDYPADLRDRVMGLAFEIMGWQQDA